MNISRYPISLATALLLAICPAIPAQDSTAAEPAVTAGFDNHGEVTAGYRFTDVRGYRPKFLELFNLRNGFRVQDFNLSGESRDRKNTFADGYSFNASGVGGDPYPTAQFTVTKVGLYDLRGNWRESHYAWNQNDNVVLPIAAAATGLSTGLTNNHDWSTVRKFGSVGLTLHATNNLRFSFEVQHNSDQGTLLTTRSLDFFNSQTYWGTFARANPFRLDAPLHDETNRIAGGIDYTRRSWNLHYKAGHQTFDETVTLGNVSSPEVSINPLAASIAAPLTQLSWSQSRRLTTPLSEFSFSGQPHAKLDWRGSYIYYRYRGPASLDQSFNGIAANSTGVLSPYTVSESGRANVVEPNHVIGQGLTWHVRNWWDVNVDYRYSRFTSESIADLESLFSSSGSTTQSNGRDDSVWRSGLHDLDLTMAFTPTPAFTVRPGIRFMKSDIEALENGVTDPARTIRTKTVRPELSFSYKPLPMFSVRGDVHSSTKGASYTAITPHTQVGGRLVFRFQPVEKLSIEDSTNLANSKLIDSNYRNTIRSNTTMISYAWSEQFSIFGGFSYESFFATGNISYARGTAPLNATLRDQEVNRVWQGGLELKPQARIGLRFTGNFDSSSGVGQMSGEPPAYGPLKWPMATGTVYYEFPKAGRLSLDMQRTYYIEKILTANNFSANLLTVRWTRGF